MQEKKKEEEEEEEEEGKEYELKNQFLTKIFGC